MLFVTINTAHHSALAFIKPLYEGSFPLHERRLWTTLLQLLNQPEMRVQALYEDNILIGFVIMWTLETWVYLEHFAITPQHRSKGLGKHVMEHLIKAANNKLVLETELPINEPAIRRVAFYERVGLQKIRFQYFQPPYRKGESSFPMQLMTSKTINDAIEVNKLTTLIKKEVYEKFY